MPSTTFENRPDAGRQLADLLSRADSGVDLNPRNCLLLALPRGGVPVAAEIAARMGLALNFLLVRKIGHPQHPEYGIGALTEGGFQWLDDTAKGADLYTSDQLQAVIEKEKAELTRREDEYRSLIPRPSFSGRQVLLVDDGTATGVTALAAARYVKSQGADEVILLTPVCPAPTAARLRAELDQVVCLLEPRHFLTVGNFFLDFTQVEDSEVKALLLAAHRPSPAEEQILRKAQALNHAADLEPLIEKLASSRIVMLGESSHGTQEFYKWRRLISQELIQKHGFSFIAVEGDWPPCAVIDRFVRSKNPRRSAREVLKSFQRWPAWMWANGETAELVEWLRLNNRPRPARRQAGFYGLDVYSLFESMDEVVKILKKIDPQLAERARDRFSCFEAYRHNEKSYVRSLLYEPEGCEDQVMEVLRELLQLRISSKARGIKSRLLDAEQNARIVKNAESYYRAMIHADEDSWNVRDRHMLETLERLLYHYGPGSKAIVWAHNTHVGDYRATEMLASGHVNLGGLAREKWGEDQVALVGFGTHRGEVTAASSWGGPVQIMPLPPGRGESCEALFHLAAQRLGQNDLLLWLRDEDTMDSALKFERGHRAVGVVYDPAGEGRGNYVLTSLTRRYDAFVFIDQTRALTPLAAENPRHEKIPETWPLGV